MEQIKNDVVMAKRILAIVRVSTQKQETESQKKELLEFIVTKGYAENQIVWLETKGASARKENDKYKAMIEDIKRTIEAREVEAVALWHLNRLGRTETSLSTMKEYFERNKIQVYIKNPNLQLFDVDSNGIKILNYGTSIAWSIFATMVKFDTEEQFEKTQRGKQYLKEQGKCVSGRARYGYTVDKDKYIRIDAQESKIVRLIYDKYVNENLTLIELAKWLNSNGYCFRNNKEWDERQISVVLSNSTYIGQGKYVYPRIIEDDIFNKCKEIRASRNAIVDKSLGRKKYYLCNKIIKCEYCGHSYTVKGERYQDGTVNSYYESKGKKCPYGMAIQIKYADAALRRSYLSSYFYYLLDSENKDKDKLTKEIVNLQSRIDNVRKSLSKLESKQVRFSDLYADGSYTKEQFDGRNKKIKGEIDDKKQDIEELGKQIDYKKGQIKAIANKVTNVRNFNRLNDTIQCMSNEEVYKRLHDSDNRLIDHAYIRKINFQNRTMTAFVVVRMDGLKDTYLVDSYNRKEEDKLIEVYLTKDNKARITRYVKSQFSEERLWLGGVNDVTISVEDIQALKSLLEPINK